LSASNRGEFSTQTNGARPSPPWWLTVALTTRRNRIGRNDLGIDWKTQTDT
jgi:hypothetical protein